MAGEQSPAKIENEQSIMATQLSYKTKRQLKLLISAAVGVSICAGFITTLSFPLLIEGPIAAIAGVMGFFISLISIRVEKPRYLAQPQNTELLNSAMYNLDILRKNSETFDITSIRTRLKDTHKLMDELFNLVQDSPHKLFSSRDYLGYYLEQCNSMVQQYQGLKTAQSKAKMASKIESNLDKIGRALLGHIDRIKNEEAFDLDLDIRVLEQDLGKKGIK